jgi:TolB protein
MRFLRLTALLTALLTISVYLAGWVGQAEPPAAIVYQAPATFGNDLRMVDARRGLLTHLTRQAGDESFPAWSPDGSHLTYFALRDNRYHLQVIDSVGRLSGSLPLARGGLGYPAWSPDGEYIAYSEERNGQAAIYTIATDCLLTQPDCTPQRLADFRAEMLQWSPDGSQVVFMSNCDNNCDLYLLTLPTGAVVQLTSNGLYDAFPAWSPDGKQIVFMSSRRTSFELYLLDLPCADSPVNCEDNLQRLTDNRDFDGFPVWSPDGRQVLYSSQRDGDFNLYEVEVGCLDDNVLPCEQAARALTTTAASEISPAWSPAGEWIAFVSGNRLAVMPAAGGAIRYLVNGVQPNQALLWQPGDGL